MSVKVFARCGLAILLIAGGGFAAGARFAAGADDPCAGYTWNVSRERALFAAAAQAIVAGRDRSSAPIIRSDSLYEVSLVSQRDVRFVVRPSDKTLARAVYAGLVRLRISAPGLYRVSAAGRSWIDVASAGKLVPSQSFMGREGCSAPRKIVAFELAPGEVVLQLSGPADRLRIAVTRAP